MKSLFCKSPLIGSKRAGSGYLAGLLIAFLTANTAGHAQSVIEPPSSVPNVPPALPQPSPTESVPSYPASSLFQWGVVVAHPHLSYRYVYGDGVQSSPGNQKKTSINTISPGVLLNIGSHWTLDYTPTQTYYSDSAFKDTLDHAVRLLGGTHYENWNFELSQSYSSSSAPLIETGRQTEEESFSTSATVGYHFNDVVQLDTNLNYNTRTSTDFTDSHETIVGERLHYQFLPGADASVSLEYGYVSVSSGSDMSFTRPGVGVNWKVTNKSSLSVNAGVENRKFRGSGEDSLNSPTFGATFSFHPFTTTSIDVNANRGVTVARFTNQVSRNTGWTVDFRQRLLQHYYFSAGYAAQKSTYISTTPLVVAGRDDKNYSVNFRLTTVIFERATAALLYQNTHNTSNSSGFGFSSSQVGIELGYQF